MHCKDRFLPRVADAFGTDATINTGTRNDAYGVALIDEFVESWESKGGSIGQQVKWNPDAPTFESEAQQLVQGDPDPLDEVATSLREVLSRSWWNRRARSA
jgi:ABC-type branched-subunit amino acid transport system substrate-binding protein